jgi:hypothetical protein
MPTMGNEPQLYLLKGDDGCNLLAKDFSTYHWITDKTTGKPTDVPNESDDDRLDALRYLIMNVLAPKGKVLVANEEKKKQAEVEILTMQNWAQKVIDEAVNRPSDIGETINISNNKGKRGSIVWDIS